MLYEVITGETDLAEIFRGPDQDGGGPASGLAGLQRFTRHSQAQTAAPVRWRHGHRSVEQRLVPVRPNDQRPDAADRDLV